MITIEKAKTSKSKCFLCGKLICMGEDKIVEIVPSMRGPLRQSAHTQCYIEADMKVKAILALKSHGTKQLKIDEMKVKPSTKLWIS